MSRSYLDVARQGRNSGWRYVLGLLVILFGLAIGSLVPGILIVRLFGLKSNAPDLSQQIAQATQTLPSVVCAICSLGFVVICFSIAIVIKAIHRRRFRTLISANTSVSLSRLVTGLGVWLLVRMVSTTIFYLFNQQAFQFNFDPVRWFLFFPAALTLALLSACVIECLFRGYLLQGLGLLTQNPYILVPVSSLLYALLYIDQPESALGNFVWGVFLTTLVLKDNRLELALGVQTADALYRWAVVGTKEFPLPSLWLVGTESSTVVIYGFVLARIAVFYYLFFGRRNRSAAEERGTEP